MIKMKDLKQAQFLNNLNKVLNTVQRPDIWSSRTQ